MLLKTTFFNFLSKLYIVFFLVGFALLPFINKGDIVLLANSNFNSVQDVFFKLFTNLGDGLFLIPVLIIALSIRQYYAFILVISALLHGIAVFVFKKILFADAPRPIAYFSDNIILHFTQGVDVHSSRSFPSGHTATAFVIAVFLSLIFQKKRLSVVFLIGAALVAYSRMYLLQHFYIDVMVGALIGTLSVHIPWLILVNYYPDTEIAFKASLLKVRKLFLGSKLFKQNA
ncbi:phosphatase PAP2 family protein [Chondrinema litorale]|uniref:phosphatase PAP2 family protein n=1 Tax=Chondrinema litorale TaxID=2994555 RepID=UPI000C587800|nr:phosphatase PAP2 family protein [Chondrinema litorale]MBT30377.1 hypothetical protein [Thalassovita sp.]UZR99260.1 phosphatase PAP2 family protein [Chondrinema litorale]